jgi:hypothetical protein
MPTSITLHVVTLVDAVSLAPPLVLDSQDLPSWFHAATDGELRLTVTTHQRPYASDECDSGFLQRVAEEVLPSTTALPVGHIALLLCQRWRVPQGAGSPRVLGLMFDLSGDDELGHYSTYNGIPREACALFLSQFTLGDVTERAREIVFNALHELGHVFNLAHDPSGQSFMIEGGYLRDTNRRFLPEDRDRLRRASNGLNPHYAYRYLPGGEPFLGVRPQSKRGAGCVGGPLRKSGRLTLEAYVGKSAYLLGEPVVLDLELRARDGVIPVRPELDPGYPTLSISYETPQGERRRYRPFGQFCTRPGARVGVSQRVALKNNPRIFMGSDGFTFPTAGEYRVWAEFETRQAGRRRLVRSNIVAFEIVLPRRRDDVAVAEVLRDPQVARYLAQSGGPLTRGRRRALHGVVRAHFRHEAVAPTRHLFARAAAREGQWQVVAECLARLRPVQPSLDEGARRLRAFARRRR